jgi:hypothetical protein
MKLTIRGCTLLLCGFRSVTAARLSPPSQRAGMAKYQCFA